MNAGVQALRLKLPDSIDLKWGLGIGLKNKTKQNSQVGFNVQRGFEGTGEATVKGWVL